MQCLVLSASSSQTCLHNSVYAMLSFSAKSESVNEAGYVYIGAIISSESVNETCYVYIGAIISSDPFWLMVSKGLLLYALSRFMSCLCITMI